MANALYTNRLILIWIIIGILSTTLGYAGAPQKFSYQAVIRDTDGELVINGSIGMQISILQGSPDGNTVYSETHQAVTNDNGLVSIEIGDGTTLTGSMGEINWAEGPYFIKSETDLGGGINYSIPATTQLLSVPYALYAETGGTPGPAGEDGVGIESVEDNEDGSYTLYFTDNSSFTTPDLTGPMGNIPDGSLPGDMLMWNGETWVVTQPGMPILRTKSIMNITETTAKSGGEVVHQGNFPVTERGVVWHTSENPSLQDHHGMTSDGSGTGTFISMLTELEPGTNYYVRAYATNTEGIAYGNQRSFQTAGGLYTVGFNVDLSYAIGQEPMEVFDPSAHTVYITGDMIEWAKPGTQPEDQIMQKISDSPLVYQKVMELDEGTYEYKYFSDAIGQGWDGSEWAGSPNRLIVVVDQDIVLNDNWGNIDDVGEFFTLKLFAYPPRGGTVSGGGEYQEGAHVDIAAVANQDWAFLEWKGDNGHLDDPFLANNTVIMPDHDINLWANFEGGNDSDIIYGDGVTDIDGNEYITVIIGEQEWMAENLLAIRNADGDTINRYCYKYDIEQYCDLYGGLYSWHTVMNGEKGSNDNSSRVQGICPTGWHVPSDAEWSELIDYLDGRSVAGGKLKEAGTVHWDSPNVGATNEVGFTALPGGMRYFNGTFMFIGRDGRWWSATGESANSAWYRDITSSCDSVYRNTTDKRMGFSVRCIRSVE